MSIEPFGYFKAEPFGWTDCAETEAGAVPLYERSAIDSLEAQLAAARSEAAEAQASEQKLRRLLVALVAEQSESISPEPENHPDHGHEVVGVWDDDNGEIAGKPCALCAIWNAAKAESLGVATNSGTALAAAIEQAVAPYREGAERYRWLRDPQTDVAMVIDKRTKWVEYHEGTKARRLAAIGSANTAAGKTLTLPSTRLGKVVRDERHAANPDPVADQVSPGAEV